MMIQHLLETDVTGMKTRYGVWNSNFGDFSWNERTQPIDAYDIDNWCYLNSIENGERNNCKHLSVYEGDASLLVDQKYDLIIISTEIYY
jgi:ribosomal protein L11 methyltransferase